MAMPLSKNLVGLAINPGIRDITLPSADELRVLHPACLRYLLSSTFQNFQTGKNTEFDLVLDRCDALGIRVLALINPETLGAIPPLDDPARGDDYAARVADIAAKIAAYYQGRLAAIEVFNEPDDQKIPAAFYAAILIATYAAIKRVSAVPVILAGITGLRLDYLQQVVQAAPTAYDYAAYHPYAQRVDNFPAPNWGLADLRASLTRARQIAGKPLWLTEIGTPLKFNYPVGMATEATVAEYLTRAYGLIAELGEDTVARAFWFTWKDFQGQSGYGLVDDAGNRRPAWYAFQQVAASAGQPQIVDVAFTPVSLQAGELVNVSITVRNNSNETLPTQGPEPGFVYEEGDTFFSRSFADIRGSYRVGIDFDGNTGVDHPYRWGLGAPLAPGETRVVTGAIRLRRAGARQFWAGLVQEQVAWMLDRAGTQTITVTTTPGGAPRLDRVAFAVTQENQRAVLNVSVTVTNASNATLVTQGPDPGFVYDEGSSFYSYAFPEVEGAFRVSVDFDGREGIDHPYRWGLGAPLAPGETRVITGAIRLARSGSRNYWAGLVRERVAWVQDRAGVTPITVDAPLQGAPKIVGVAFAPTTLIASQRLNVSITVRNDSGEILQTQGPEPGFVYEEGESFRSRQFEETRGAYRVGIDFDGRTGVDHPYRWGLGAPLAPGETRVITGAIRLKNVGARNFWAGLVQEQVAWKQDDEGAQAVTVNAPGKPQIVAVAFAPTALNADDVVNVSITVKNNSTEPLATQSPAPGVVYEEGESFYTRGFPDVAGAHRVGVDFDVRTGIDHPYRWGLGAPLAPGEMRVIAGGIRLKRAQAQNFWAGLAREQIAWVEDRAGVQMLRVAAGAKPRVVHVHDTRATRWDGVAGDYWNYVDQAVVDDMVARGLTTLTRAANIAEAWRVLMPHYQPGQGIAIKLNFTNKGALGKIDSLHQTLNAIVRGLQQIGVRAEDVWVYDTNTIADYFAQGCQFPGVKFFDKTPRLPITFNSADPHAVIAFNPLPGTPAEPLIGMKLADVLVNATYAINLPTFKAHITGAGVTLGFKNHMGSTSNPPAFHAYVWPPPLGQYFRWDYNAFVDLYLNPHIRHKTVLTIGDGLFAGDRWDSPPLLLRTFGDQTPNSLFFATDPVAIDAVMYDFLAAEWTIRAGADNYLRLASEMGLGVYERGDPREAGYNQIEYVRV